MASGIVLWYISWVHWTSTMQSMMGIYWVWKHNILMTPHKFCDPSEITQNFVFWVVFRYYCPYVHCWQTQTQMILSFQKLPTCTRLTGPNMRPPPVAGRRSTPWDDTEDNLCPFPKHFVTLVSLSPPFLFFSLSIGWNNNKKKNCRWGNSDWFFLKWGELVSKPF